MFDRTNRKMEKMRSEKTIMLMDTPFTKIFLRMSWEAFLRKYIGL
jgi:hypothetical protein